MTPRPKLVVKAMKTWQAAVLRVIGWMIGIRGEAKISYIIFDNDKEEPTINDIIKNQEENDFDDDNEDLINRNRDW